MNIQLKDLKNVLLCSGIILKRVDTLEEWQAKVSDIDEYGEMYIKRLSSRDNNIVIEVQKEHGE